MKRTTTSNYFIVNKAEAETEQQIAVNKYHHCLVLFCFDVLHIVGGIKY